MNAGEASAIVRRNPVRISFRDGRGGSCSRRSRTGCPARSSSRPRSIPSPAALISYRRRRSTRRSRSQSGREQIEQNPGPGPFVGDLVQAQRSGIQYSARSVVRARRSGRGVRLELSTNDPSGRRLIVTLSAQGRRSIRVSVRPSRPAGVAGRRGLVRLLGATRPSTDSAGATTRSTSAATRSRASSIRRTCRRRLPRARPGPPDRYMSPNGPTGAYFVQSSFVSSRPYGFLLAARRADALADGERPPRCVAGGRVGAGPGLRRGARPAGPARSAR